MVALDSRRVRQHGARAREASWVRLEQGHGQPKGESSSVSMTHRRHGRRVLKNHRWWAKARFYGGLGSLVKAIWARVEG